MSNVRLLCNEEDMAKGGRDNSGAQGIFLPSKKPNLKSGRILVIVRMRRMAAQSAGAVRRKSLRGAATHPVYTTITLNCSANAR